MNFQRPLWHAFILALPFFISSCATVPPFPTPGIESIPNTQPQVSSRLFHDSLDLSGRISVRYQVHHREETLHGSFLWAQTPISSTATLLSPLGQTLAIIKVTPGSATLVQANHTTRQATNVDALTEEVLGWPLPVAGLRDWLQGFATSVDGNRIIATSETNQVVTQDGWRLRYSSWDTLHAAPEQQRPRRIDLDRTTAQAGEVSIRIVIDTWHPH